MAIAEKAPGTAANIIAQEASIIRLLAQLSPTGADPDDIVSAVNQPSCEPLGLAPLLALWDDVNGLRDVPKSELQDPGKWFSIYPINDGPEFSGDTKYFGVGLADVDFYHMTYRRKPLGFLAVHSATEDRPAVIEFDVKHRSIDDPGFIADAISKISDGPEEKAALVVVTHSVRLRLIEGGKVSKAVDPDLLIPNPQLKKVS
ncbi:MAG TPA: hypothetical protein VH234_01900 [Candidatus Saccharimonadales bacterium]|jgi:hypothetical protein|nr:hypothetical protein [Candidatus Saccharimonadales bacterium]